MAGEKEADGGGGCHGDQIRTPSLSRFRLALLAQSLYLDLLMLRPVRLLVPVWLALASPAIALTAGADTAGADTAAAAPPVRLAAPRHGAILQAGGLAVLAWEPLSAFDRLARVQEWEAFLSLDGGAHYPIRITPHLDRDLRRVLWQVPRIPTRDARLLLRFGDEQKETVFELPERFAISGTASLFEALTASQAAAPGEPARPGDAGVVAWVEGSRRGGGLRQVVATDAAGLAAGQSVAPAEAWQLALESEDSVPDAESPRAGRVLRVQDLRSSAPGHFERAAWPAPIPILLLIQRQNE
jgi:hypothetical protein